MKDKIIDILEKWTDVNLKDYSKCADEILKMAEFEALCNPDIYEAHMNEHFEEQIKNKDKLIDDCLALLYILKNGFHLSNPNQYFGMKCELEVEIEKLKKELGL
jgi:hypothetical protein